MSCQQLESDMKQCGMMIMEGRNPKGLHVQGDLKQMSKASFLLALVASLPTTATAASTNDDGMTFTIMNIIIVFVMGMMFGMYVSYRYHKWRAQEIQDEKGKEERIPEALGSGQPRAQEEVPEVSGSGQLRARGTIYISTSSRPVLRYHTFRDCKALKQVKEVQEHEWCYFCRKRD